MLISGGVNTVLEALIPDYDTLFNVKHINNACFDPMTGELVDITPTPYDWSDDYKGVAGKNVALKRACSKYNLTLQDAIFVGDAENDFKAMSIAERRIFVFEKGSRIKLPAGTEPFCGNDFMELVDLILDTPIA